MLQVQNVQVVWFETTTEGKTASDLFLLGFDQEANTATTSRTITPTNPNLSTALGDIEGVACSVAVQPGRVDVTLAASATGFALDNLMNVLAGDRALTIAEKFISQTIAQMTNTIRVAIVVNCVKPLMTFERAVADFYSMVGHALPSTDISDLQFQVNRRVLGPEGVPINRLVRLGIISVQLVAAPGGNLVGAQEIVFAQDRFSPSIMLDFNTVPQSVVILPAVQNDIFAAILAQHRKFIAADEVVSALWE